MRLSGQGVTFCCGGEGNPTPEFEWFKDNSIIDKDVYHYNHTLEISNVSGLMGRYRCRVVNDYGSEFSDVANLQVLNTSEEVSCNPTPISRNVTLPEGCALYGTTNDIVDVGRCVPAPCLRSDSALSNTACQDKRFCCVVEEVEEVTITCGGSATFNISKVTRCGCQACEIPKSYISGVVVGLKGAVEKPIAYCEIKVGNDYYYSGGKGAFKLKVPDDKQRLAVVFKDSFDLEYADFTKVFRIVKGQSLFSKIVMRVKPAPKPFNSFEPFKVPLGDSFVDSAFAEIEIPENALLKEDGTIYSGQANLRLSVMDPRNVSDVLTAPADFSTVDEDGEEQLLVTYGMLNLDFEDDSGNKLSTSKPIKMFIDPEKLNISVDSNGNTTTKLWWLDEKTGRWMEAGNLWLDTKQTNRSKRSPTRFLLTEITPVVQRRGTLNIDVTQNFGAVRVTAPAGSTVRILCEEPNQSVTTYAGYLEGAVDDSTVTCISVWINRQCYMQGEGSDARFLDPSDPDHGFPAFVSASIIETQLTSVGSSPSVRSFRFNVNAHSNGPVYPHENDDVQTCRAPQLVEGHRQFEFTSSASASLDLISARPSPPLDFRDPLSWYPARTGNDEILNCFIKILAHGKGSIFLASSYRANKTDKANKFGDSVAMAIPATDGKYVACLEIRCPGNVYHKNTNKLVPEWTHVLVTHLTGTCHFQKHHLQKQDNLDNNGDKCPSRAKRHAAGTENWFCIPLPFGSFDIYTVYTSLRRERQKGVNRCYTADNGWHSGPADPSQNIATIEFSCRLSDDSYKSTVKTFNWPNDGDKCYVKVKVSGRRSVFKAESYRANKKDLYGYSTDITTPTLDDAEASATCLEYRCSAMLSNGSFSENTHIVIRPILGDCKVLNKGNDLDLYQSQCPYSLPPQQGLNRSICDVPLPPFLLDVPGLYNSLCYPWGTTESSCRTGDPRLGFLFSGMFSRGYALHYNCT
ncbi:hypothetical protein ACROYT_G031647 [Oculina patagonica]